MFNPLIPGIKKSIHLANCPLEAELWYTKKNLFTIGWVLWIQVKRLSFCKRIVSWKMMERQFFWHFFQIFESWMKKSTITVKINDIVFYIDRDSQKTHCFSQWQSPTKRICLLFLILDEIEHDVCQLACAAGAPWTLPWLLLSLSLLAGAFVRDYA